MSQSNQEYLEVADKLEAYCDYGNPSGLNDLLVQAAELLRNSKPLNPEKEDNPN